MCGRMVVQRVDPFNDPSALKQTNSAPKKRGDHWPDKCMCGKPATPLSSMPVKPLNP